MKKFFFADFTAREEVYKKKYLKFPDILSFFFCFSMQKKNQKCKKFMLFILCCMEFSMGDFLVLTPIYIKIFK